MPNCFQLWRGDSAVPLSQIDDEMRLHFGAPSHPTDYYESWYDLVGSLLASGYSFDRVREVYADAPELCAVVDWLEKNFTVRHWYERSGWPR